MPDTVPTPSGVNATAAPSSTPPGGTATAATPPPAEWRAGENAPAWAKGKSSEEILGIAQRMVEAGLGTGIVSAPAVPAAPATVPANTSDDDFVTGRDLKTFGSNVARSLDMAANTNLAYIKREYAKEFQKYGPEISAKLARVPREMWDLDTLETVVKLVKVDHHDEIVREAATQLAATMEPTIRSTGVVGSVPVPSKDASLESDKIPPEWRERAQRVGITERTVQEFCAANDMTPEAFYKQFETPRTPIAAEIGKVGTR